MSRLVYYDAAERERMYDVMARMRPPFSVALGILIVPAMLAIPVYGWVCELPLIAAALVYGVTDVNLRRLRHPERWVIGAWAFAELMILLMIVLADGPREYLLAVPMVPMLGVTMIIGRRIALACACALASLLCLTAGLTMWDEVTALPPVLIFPVAFIIASALAGMAALDGGFVSRQTSVVDPLTGLLNRVALQTRTTELAAQARVNGERVALTVVELDRFRKIAAEHGPATADAVLAEIARRLRMELDADSTVFRFDGATFVVLGSGITRASAVATAERLRAAVSASAIDDVAVTASLGIAVYHGEDFDFAELYTRGAAALDLAQTAGGNRVCLAPDGPAASPPLAAAPERGERPALTAQLGDDWTARLRTATDGTRLMPNRIDRAHAVDALARTRRLTSATAAVLGAAIALSSLWAGWLMLVPAIAAVLAWEVTNRLVPRARRPEYPAFAGLVAVLAAGGLWIAAAGPVGVFALPALAIVVLGGCSGFPKLGAVLLALIGVATTVITGLAVGLPDIAEGPVILALAITVVIGFAVMGEVMGRTARDHRVTAITDPLTQTLNHAALDARIPAFEQLAVDRALSLVLVGLAGDRPDAVREAAARLRGAVHPFDPVYRVGPHEFAVLLSDLEGDRAQKVADRIAAAIGDEDTAVGVASVPAGDVCCLDMLFAEAAAAQRAAGRPADQRSLVAA